MLDKRSKKVAGSTSALNNILGRGRMRYRLKNASLYLNLMHGTKASAVYSRAGSGSNPSKLVYGAKAWSRFERNHGKESAVFIRMAAIGPFTTLSSPSVCSLKSAFSN
jgi:hypothetical protein